MKIFLGADHRGFKLKEGIKQWLIDQGRSVEDLGNDHFDPQDDFPDFAAAVSRRVGAGEGEGIVICGSGGMVLVANKFKNVRAVECWNELTGRHAKEHDHANVLMLPADFVDQVEAEKVVAAWLKARPLTDEKHSRRLNKISIIEKDNLC